MRITQYDFKLLVIIAFSLFFEVFVFGQKTLDHKLFLEKIKHSSDNIYKECLDEYGAYLEQFPEDVLVLIEKCKFIQNAQYDDDINPNQEAFDSCSAYVVKRFPSHPDVLLFQTTYLWGEEEKEVFKSAEQSIEDNPEKWSKTNLAAMYETMADFYYSDSDYKKALFYMDKAILNDEQYQYTIEYARILLKLEKKKEALSVLIAIPDTAKNIWQLGQKADLLLELENYSDALKIYNQVELMDSSYINKADFASTLEGFGQYESAREYLLADTSRTYSKKEALLRLLNHDLKYQDGSKSISSYNSFRDLGYSSDPISLLRLKLFFFHPAQPWNLRDLLGIISLLALLAILIVIPYIWILPVYFSGSRYKFLSPNNPYVSNWTLKGFWFVSIGYLLASLFACVIEPEELYSIFIDFNYAGMSTDKLGFQILIFTIFMALFGLMAMYRVKPNLLLSHSFSIGRSILTGIGIYILFRFISGIYISIGTKVFDVSIDDIANVSKILLASRQDIEAVISTFGKMSCILLLGVMVPIYEEIYFRGVILDSCQRHINFNAANIFQSFLFAAIHGSLFMFPLFFLFGLLAGIVRKKSGGLLPGIVFHIVNNVTVLLVFFNK